MPRFLSHNQIQLALHELGTSDPSTAAPDGTLLLLHGLGECTERSPLRANIGDGWNGPIYGLDFTGHGRSGHSIGGGYTSETLMADVDAALGCLGPCTIVGRGLGAYIALLIAGARPSLVRGAILTDGPGLAGGSSRPTSISIPIAEAAPVEGQPDPWALIELARDIRPPDYAMTLLRQAVIQSGLRYPITVCAKWKPEWLTAVADDPSVLQVEFAAALAEYRAVR